MLMLTQMDTSAEAWLERFREQPVDRYVDPNIHA
jgi:hypothetical protein